jgi:hypothetical protein
MRFEQLRQKLLTVAKEVPADDRVPYGFEKRIMAMLAGQPIPDVWALWSHALWRAAIPCVAAVVVLVAVSTIVADKNSGVETVAKAESFSPDFEQTMLAVVDQPGEVW